MRCCSTNGTQPLRLVCWISRSDLSITTKGNQIGTNWVTPKDAAEHELLLNQLASSVKKNWKNGNFIFQKCSTFSSWRNWSGRPGSDFDPRAPLDAVRRLFRPAAEKRRRRRTINLADWKPWVDSAVPVRKQSSWSKGISEMKSKQQSPCSNCMHWPVHRPHTYMACDIMEQCMQYMHAKAFQ